MSEPWQEVVRRHAPPYAVGDRVWTVLGHRDGSVPYRGHFTEPEEAEAKAAQLLGDGWRVTTLVPPRKEQLT